MQILKQTALFICVYAKKALPLQRIYKKTLTILYNYLETDVAMGYNSRKIS